MDPAKTGISSLSPEARPAFDVAAESSSLREHYGMHRFGQSCLMARRLVENGARFVVINTFSTIFHEATWDIHGCKPFSSFDAMKNIVAPMYDQAYSALLQDLSQRGMLDTTLVAAYSEFGRTPQINPTGGRDHWTHCWTVKLAGGGVKGGRVIGKSDAIGAYPVERPVRAEELVATLYHSLGLDPATRLARPDGTTVPLVDAGHAPVMELFS